MSDDISYVNSLARFGRAQAPTVLVAPVRRRRPRHGDTVGHEGLQIQRFIGRRA